MQRGMLVHYSGLMSSKMWSLRMNFFALTTEIWLGTSTEIADFDRFFDDLDPCSLWPMIWFRMCF